MKFYHSVHSGPYELKEPNELSELNELKFILIVISSPYAAVNFSDHTCAQQEFTWSSASAVYCYTCMHYAADGTGVLHQRGARASELQPPLR